jgi:dihydrofolate synthase/folylpolyglutamate synthase
MDKMIPDKLKRFINNENLVHYRQDLDHVRALLEHIGNPQSCIKTIHIAGTNGKGSVAHMLNSIFIKSGYITGLYTSPHLLEINERIKIQNENIPDELLSDYVDQIAAYSDSTGRMPTFFDMLTACAFRYFCDKRVDIAIIETGLGGRLDSTNVVTPLCSIITSISMDHNDILGATLPAIAGEKAGIIKKNVPVITVNQERGVLDVIDSVARSKQSDLFVLNGHFSINKIIENDDGYIYDYSLNVNPSTTMSRVELNNPVVVQIANSSLAITASIIVRNYYPNLTDENIRRGLKTFIVPGRCQILSTTPLVLYDPAHNEAAMDLMIKFILEKYAHRDITLVLTIMKDKNINNILPIIKKSAKPVIYYILDDPRCYQPTASESSYYNKIIIHDEDALHALLDSIKSKNSMFFFLGSFRLYRVALNYAKHK